MDEHFIWVGVRVHFSCYIFSSYKPFPLIQVAFFVAFLSWFAFPPLIPDAIKSDLHLTTAQVGNSNIIALSSTLLFRAAVGPMVDRYGPRKVMAWLLILGAIPSGLAGLAHNVQSFYVLRFFIGILGATFVPCQAWTSAFFDTSRVGTANALVAGWGKYHNWYLLSNLINNIYCILFRAC